jgi:glycosyltransferase involved in cell wall biosynthesis
MTLPTASVVVPNYNHGKFLPRCLDALLLQSIPPLEVIVIDDASHDDSLQVLEAYARRFPSLRIVQNQQNRGVCYGLNHGLALARGDYVCFPAADDEVLPGLFEHLLPLLARHPQAGTACGRTEWRCQSTGLSWTYGLPMPDQPGFLSPDDLVRLARAGRFALSGQHMLYRKSALLDAGGWIPELRWFTDAFSGWVVSLRHGTCFTPHTLSVFNLFPSSFYNAAQNSARREVMQHLLRLLQSPAYADVAPRIRDSGLLGGFGPDMLRVTLANPGHRRFINLPFLRLALRRSAELAGRRLLPRPLARLALRLRQPSPVAAGVPPAVEPGVPPGGPTQG